MFIPILIRAQSIPTLTTYSNFKCEVYLEVYNGLYDWYGNQDYSGGNPIKAPAFLCLTPLRPPD